MSNGIAFAQVLEQLMNEKYKRNRVGLADAAHVSPSALSQYSRGRATPSLEVLVALAKKLDVSLEYLVFGKERVTPPPELSYLAAHLEAQMRNSQVQAASLQDLVARIGAQVGDIIAKTAEDLLPKVSKLSGMLDATDIVSLESCSSRTTIVTTDLSLDVLVLKHNQDDDVAAPSVFAQVVAENIRQGSYYDYIIPQGPTWIQAVRLLKQELIRIGEIDPAHLERHLNVYHVPKACVPGYVVQHFTIEQLQREAPSIANRIERFTYRDPDYNDSGFVGYVELTNINNQNFALIARENVPRLLDELREIRHFTTNSKR